MDNPLKATEDDGAGIRCDLDTKHSNECLTASAVRPERIVCQAGQTFDTVPCILFHRTMSRATPSPFRQR
jgi:hypothetical protein